MKSVLSGILVAVLSVSSLASGDAAELGKQTYMTVCVACHQPTGLGLPPVFPGISKTEYVEGAQDRLVGIVLKGIMGPITVNGVVFNNVMPPQEAMLNDEKIAAVLTYVRSSFGNNAPAISVDTVAEVRKKLGERKAPWTEAELKAWQSQ
jgi:mono/diheme cytochrome c family protein